MFTSSENARSFEHMPFRHSFPEPWFSEAIARDTEALTKALQKSLSHDPLLPAAPIPDSKPDSTPTYISDPETASKRARNSMPAGGKITKRKSRASKRSPTTFITADPANFRQMVQQVTGIRLGNSHMPVSPVVKPEPRRGSRMQMCLPTLDTSAFLLDHHHQQVVGPADAPPAAMAPVSFTPECGGLEFETAFPTFPTLESWRVM